MEPEEYEYEHDYYEDEDDEYWDDEEWEYEDDEDDTYFFEKGEEI